MVNNAGITKDGLLMAMSEEDFCRVIDTNLKGTFNCIRHVARQMLKQKSGRIVNMASMLASAETPDRLIMQPQSRCDRSHKDCSKGTCIKRNYRKCRCSWLYQNGHDRCTSDKVKEETLKNIPMGTYGEPEDVAKAVAFLHHRKPDILQGRFCA